MEGPDPNTGVGDPCAGTKEKGEKYLNVVVPRLAKYFSDLSTANVNEQASRFDRSSHSFKSFSSSARHLFHPHESNFAASHPCR